MSNDTTAPQITQAIRSLIEWAYDQGARFGDEITAEVWFYEAEEAGSISKRLPDIAALAGAPLPAQSAAPAQADEARDAARYRFIEEHATMHGGGNGFTITCFVGADEEDIGCGIDAAIEKEKA